MKLLTSRCKKAKTFRGDFAKVCRALKSSPCNTIADGGADTYLLGSAFTMVSYTNRMANVAGFDDTLTITDKKIGTGVAAYDLQDGTTVLVMIFEAIDHTDQPNSMLATNQIRHHGIDVCDVHPNFTVGGRSGLFRIKLDDVEFSFEMENSLAPLRLRRPTETKLEKCDVYQMTSDAEWDPSALLGIILRPESTIIIMRRPISKSIMLLLLPRMHLLIVTHLRLLICLLQAKLRIL